MKYRFDRYIFRFVRYRYPQWTFCLSLRHLEDVFKTCFQDIFKTCLQDVFKTCPQDVLKTSSGRLGRRKVFTMKTCWRRLQDMSWRCLEDQQIFAEWTQIKFMVCWTWTWKILELPYCTRFDVMIYWTRTWKVPRLPCWS